jgi:hypothetical protein
MASYPPISPVLLFAQTLELAIRNLVNPRPAPDAMLEASLRKALQLSRMTLFEIDVTIMEYVNLANNLVLANMWRYRQPAAAVSVARHALTNRLMEKTTEQTRGCLLSHGMHSIYSVWSGKIRCGLVDMVVSGRTGFNSCVSTHTHAIVVPFADTAADA